MLDSKTRLPLYIQVKDYLIGLTASGVYPPGTKLPTENALMDTLKVGRATVRAALAELEREGRVLKKHGIGTFVSEPEASYSFEPIVSLSYSLKKMGLDFVNKTLESTLIEDGSGVLPGWPKGKRAGHLKRLRIAAGKPVAVEDSFFDEDLFRVICSLEPSQSVARAILSQSGTVISKVDLCIVLRAPSDLEAGYLQLQQGKKVAEMTRWIYNNNGKPINFVRFVMPEEFMGSSFLGKADV